MGSVFIETHNKSYSWLLCAQHKCNDTIKSKLFLRIFVSTVDKLLLNNRYLKNKKELKNGILILIQDTEEVLKPLL